MINNPKKLFHRLTAKAKKVHLSQQEKAEIRARLEAFMLTDTQPETTLTEEVTVWLMVQRKFQDFRYDFHDLVTNPAKGKKKRFILTAFAVLIILVSGGTSFAADSSVPGDSLYSIKMAGEKMRSLLAVTPVQKAKLATVQAIARLEETEKLAAKGKESEKSRDEAIAHFKQQANYVKSQVNLLRTTTNSITSDDLDTQFRTVLESHQDILRQISKENQPDSAIDNLTLYINKELLGNNVSTSTD